VREAMLFLCGLISPPALRKALARRAYILLLFKNIFNNFCQTNYLNI